MKRFAIMHGMFFILVLLGCNKSPIPEDLPPLQSAVVELKQNGTPLPEAMVMLYSTDPAFKWNVAATTGPSGKAVLHTHGKHPGVPIGCYKIVVTKTEPESKDDKTIVLFDLVDPQYSRTETTPLEWEVEKGKNVKSFDLGKPVRQKGETVSL